MKHIITCYSLILLLILPQSLHAKSHHNARRYLFFLHQKFVELFDLNTIHPEYGRAEYPETLDKFRLAGFVVISEKRPRDTHEGIYAKKVVFQIDSLLKRGVPPGNITVIGCSKGGYIAQYVSTWLHNPKVNFVFIGCYRDVDIADLPEIQFCGNILSIYEQSDTLGVSAIKRKQTSHLPIPHFKEIALHTNRKHGFLYHPLDEWVLPAIEWAKGNYGF